MKILENLFQNHRLSFPYKQTQESLHLEPASNILQLIATLTQHHCNPWKKYKKYLFPIKIYSSANRNVEMQTQALTYLGWKPSIKYLVW